MEKPRTALFMMLFVILGVIMPVVYYTSSQKLDERLNSYRTYGEKVECTVVETSTFLGVSKVTAYYMRDDKPFYTHAVLGRKVRVNDTFTAYALPNYLYEVYDADRKRGSAAGGIVALSSVVGWLALILYLYDLKNYKVLEELGKDAEAELMSVERWDSGTLFGSFRFENDNGKMRTVRIYIPHNVADVYEKYSIKYYEQANGTILAAAADIRLL